MEETPHAVTLLSTAADTGTPPNRDPPASQDIDETWDSFESGSSQEEPRWLLSDFRCNSTLRHNAKANNMKAPPSFQHGHVGPAVHHAGPSQVNMEVLSFANNPALLCRPCVDCGTRTGSFCDFCRAEDRLPHHRWAKGQCTPLCTSCDHMRSACHFCLGLYCTLFPYTQQGTPPDPNNASSAPRQTATRGD